jgi:hypothetical protein
MPFKPAALVGRHRQCLPFHGGLTEESAGNFSQLRENFFSVALIACLDLIAGARAAIRGRTSHEKPGSDAGPFSIGAMSG